jgi:hypothetical protein
MVTACDWAPGRVTTTLAVPETLGSGRTSQGTCAASIFSETNCRGAAMPLKVTETSAMVLERGTVSRRASPEARLVPKIEIMEPGATPAPRSKLAALATPPSETTGSGLAQRTASGAFYAEVFLAVAFLAGFG